MLIDPKIILDAIEHAMKRFERCHCRSCHDALRYVQKKVRAEQSKRRCCASCKYWQTEPTDCPMCHEQTYDDDGWTEYYVSDRTKDDGSGYCDRYEARE